MTDILSASSVSLAFHPHYTLTIGNESTVDNLLESIEQFTVQSRMQAMVLLGSFSTGTAHTNDACELSKKEVTLKLNTSPEKVKSLLEQMQQSPNFEQRHLSLLSCHGSGDLEHVFRSLTDDSLVIRRLASNIFPDVLTKKLQNSTSDEENQSLYDCFKKFLLNCPDSLWFTFSKLVISKRNTSKHGKKLQEIIDNVISTMPDDILLQKLHFITSCSTQVIMQKESLFINHANILTWTQLSRSNPSAVIQLFLRWASRLVLKMHEFNEELKPAYSPSTEQQDILLKLKELVGENSCNNLMPEDIDPILLRSPVSQFSVLTVLFNNCLPTLKRHSLLFQDSLPTQNTENKNTSEAEEIDHCHIPYHCGTVDGKTKQISNPDKAALIYLIRILLNAVNSRFLDLNNILPSMPLDIANLYLEKFDFERVNKAVPGYPSLDAASVLSEPHQPPKNIHDVDLARLPLSYTINRLDMNKVLTFLSSVGATSANRSKHIRNNIPGYRYRTYGHHIFTTDFTPVCHKLPIELIVNLLQKDLENRVAFNYYRVFYKLNSNQRVELYNNAEKLPNFRNKFGIMDSLLIKYLPSELRNIEAKRALDYLDIQLKPPIKNISKDPLEAQTSFSQLTYRQELQRLNLIMLYSWENTKQICDSFLSHPKYEFKTAALDVLISLVQCTHSHLLDLISDYLLPQLKSFNSISSYIITKMSSIPFNLLRRIYRNQTPSEIVSTKELLLEFATHLLRLSFDQWRNIYSSAMSSAILLFPYLDIDQCMQLLDIFFQSRGRSYLTVLSIEHSLKQCIGKLPVESVRRIADDIIFPLIEAETQNFEKTHSVYHRYSAIDLYSILSYCNDVYKECLPKLLNIAEHTGLLSVVHYALHCVESYPCVNDGYRISFPRKRRCSFHPSDSNTIESGKNIVIAYLLNHLFEDESWIILPNSQRSMLFYRQDIIVKHNFYHRHHLTGKWNHYEPRMTNLVFNKGYMAPIYLPRARLLPTRLQKSIIDDSLEILKVSEEATIEARNYVSKVGDEYVHYSSEFDMGDSDTTSNEANRNNHQRYGSTSSNSYEKIPQDIRIRFNSQVNTSFDTPQNTPSSGLILDPSLFDSPTLNVCISKLQLFPYLPSVPPTSLMERIQNDKRPLICISLIHIISRIDSLSAEKLFLDFLQTISTRIGEIFEQNLAIIASGQKLPKKVLPTFPKNRGPGISGMNTEVDEETLLKEEQSACTDVMIRILRRHTSEDGAAILRQIPPLRPRIGKARVRLTLQLPDPAISFFEFSSMLSEKCHRDVFKIILQTLMSDYVYHSNTWMSVLKSVQSSAEEIIRTVTESILSLLSKDLDRLVINDKRITPKQNVSAEQKTTDPSSSSAPPSDTTETNPTPKARASTAAKIVFPKGNQSLRWWLNEIFIVFVQHSSLAMRVIAFQTLHQTSERGLQTVRPGIICKNDSERRLLHLVFKQIEAPVVFPVEEELRSEAIAALPQVMLSDDIDTVFEFLDHLKNSSEKDKPMILRQIISKLINVVLSVSPAYTSDYNISDYFVREFRLMEPLANRLLNFLETSPKKYASLYLRLLLGITWPEDFISRIQSAIQKGLLTANFISENISLFENSLTLNYIRNTVRNKYIQQHRTDYKYPKNARVRRMIPVSDLEQKLVESTDVALRRIGTCFLLTGKGRAHFKLLEKLAEDSDPVIAASASEAVLKHAARRELQHKLREERRRLVSLRKKLRERDSQNYRRNQYQEESVSSSEETFGYSDVINGNFHEYSFTRSFDMHRPRI